VSKPEPTQRVNPLDAWTVAKVGCGGTALSRSDLSAYQATRLRETIAWAKQRSPFYRRLLGNVDVATLLGPDDLRHLPFTTADDLRRSDPPLLCLSQSEISHVVTLATSGTSGVPKRLFFTAEEQEATIDFYHHGMCLPARAGDRVLILFPGERPGSVGDLLATALRRLGATPIAAGWPQDPAAAAALLRRERPDVVAGAPVPVLAVARHTATLGSPPVRVRSVLLSSDHVAGSLRQSLMNLWGCEVFEHYGMTEMALSGGVDCDAHAGYHMPESELLIEVVNPLNGEPVVPGETGEVVFSTLTRRGMPLIRYRSGDLSRVLPGACACGSPLLRLARLHRRVAGGIRVGDKGDLTMAMLDEALFALDGIDDFSAAFRPGTSPTLHVEVTRASHDPTGETALLTAVRAALEAIPVLAETSASPSGHLSVAISRDKGLPRRVGKRTISMQARS
jgi:phenylacetate-coenzyme A ligase PaaK-like adenylate-forming protein